MASKYFANHGGWLNKGQVALDYAIGKLPESEAFTEKSLASYAKTLDRNSYRAFTPPELDMVLAALCAGKGRKLTAIQAGANDGIDPVYRLFHRYFSKIVLVEPQPQLLPKLRETYAAFEGDAIFENMAVGDGSPLILHIPDQHMEEVYLRKVGRSSSFVVGTDRSLTIRIMCNRCEVTVEEAEQHVIATAIPSMTVEGLAKKHQIEELDFLQVDCEGYDWQVLRTLGDHRPAVINFESKLLSEADWRAWVKFAKANDYGFVVCKTDTLAIKGARFD